ncbi:hypothetical protein GE061_005046 [Apolygus lucorum]|uniref:Uncharacterized protein n=1 Tax=Apolygus lucorum TaxID=248454 RepID=A0A6A4J5T3_APOLU|nr:hypothetical protein GE061_005046 [Apolygus lucorum]
MKVALSLLSAFAVASFASVVSSEDGTADRRFGWWRPYGYGWRPYYKPSWCHDQGAPQVEETVDEGPEPPPPQATAPVGEHKLPPVKENTVSTVHGEQSPSQQLPAGLQDPSKERPQQSHQQTPATQQNPTVQLNSAEDQQVDPIPSPQQSESQDTPEIPNGSSSAESESESDVETIELAFRQDSREKLHQPHSGEYEYGSDESVELALRTRV